MASVPADEQQRQLLQLAAERLLNGDRARQASASNYDFVKIKVRLGSQLEHYYILSRFLLSRMLTVITLPQHKAIRIALDVKKHLVDHDRLDITQEELEEVLFAILRSKGFGDEYVRRYQMVTRFFQQKRPLIILIAGSACTGKSSLAQQLASRLNLPNVLQTDVLYELLRASGASDLPAEPLWSRPLPPGSSLLGEFTRECATIRRALDGDLCKCIRDGKSIIIEGLHLDPGLFLREFGDPRGEPVMVAAGSLEMPPLSSVEAAAAAEAAEAHGQLPAAAGAAAGAEATAQQLAGLWVSSADDGDAAQPTAAAAAPPAEAAPATGGAPDAAAAQPQAEAWQTAAAVRRTASFGDAVPSLSWGSQHRHQSPWKDAPSSRVLLRPSSARPRLGEGVDRGQAVFMLRAPDGSSSSGTALGSPGQADAAAPVPSPRLAACISLPAAFQDVPSLLTLGEGGLQPDPAAAATAAASRPPLPSLAEEVEAEAGGGSDASTSSPQQQHAASAAAPLPPAPGSSVAAADAAAAAAAGTGPVFVPICLAVPEEEYGVMLQDWLARRPPAAGSEWEPGGWAAASAESGRRLRQLQAHLRQYGASGVPVVEVSLSDMGQALDQLHAYVLLCIELALGEGPPAAAAAGGEAPA